MRIFWSTTFNGDCQQNSQIFRINVSSITTVNLMRRMIQHAQEEILNFLQLVLGLGMSFLSILAVLLRHNNHQLLIHGAQQF